MALSHVVSEIFNVEKYPNLEIRVKGQSRSLKVVPFDRLDMVSFQCSIATLSPRRTSIFETFNFENAVTLRTGLRVRQGH